MPILKYEYDFITGKKNPIGTHIEIETDAEKGSAACAWTVQENYIGYDHILHGGIAGKRHEQGNHSAAVSGHGETGLYPHPNRLPAIFRYAEGQC